MSRLPALLLSGLALPGLCLPAGAASPVAPPQVTIYRCTDAKGQLSLRDSPCRGGERQQVRSMLRPTDPPPRPVIASSRRPARSESPGMPRVVYLTPPRPTYECTTPDGDRYTSESPEGNPRWVPLWTLGIPAVVYPSGPSGSSALIRYRDRHTDVRIDAGRTWRGPGQVVASPLGYAAAGGTWIRDACQMLPPVESCARLQDRRDELDRRYYSALQGEREAITREERGLDARLSAECGA